jgi:lipopolysaccharide/colanic/teichoic acid biosynthesis glycosyltransferase
MMAEWAETHSAETNFKKDLILNIDIVAWWRVNKTENSNTKYSRMLRYNSQYRDQWQVILNMLYIFWFIKE